MLDPVMGNRRVPSLRRRQKVVPIRGGGAVVDHNSDSLTSPRSVPPQQRDHVSVRTRRRGARRVGYRIRVGGMTTSKRVGPRRDPV
jgi:hypothetical protein